MRGKELQATEVTEQYIQRKKSRGLAGVEDKDHRGGARPGVAETQMKTSYEDAMKLYTLSTFGSING